MKAAELRNMGNDELTARVASNLQLARLRRETERKLREESRMLETLNRVGTAVSAELDLNRAVQVVTDAATESLAEPVV